MKNLKKLKEICLSECEMHAEAAVKAHIDKDRKEFERNIEHISTYKHCICEIAELFGYESEHIATDNPHKSGIFGK
jgi:hypothetical protein